MMRVIDGNSLNCAICGTSIRLVARTAKGNLRLTHSALGASAHEVVVRVAPAWSSVVSRIPRHT